MNPKVELDPELRGRLEDVRSRLAAPRGQHSAGAPSRARPWPDPPADPAYSGLAGDAVRTIEPHTEADPAAMLVTFLAAFGNACDRGAGFYTDGAYQATNLFAVIVGESAKARKGTSWGQVRRLFDRADPGWTAERVVSGLSTGEGLIHAVRDTVMGIGDDGEEKVEQAGVEDKRLFAIQPEFAQVLKVMRREGNTLSPALRTLWDDGRAQTLTRGSPQRATGALVSIIGHITEEELRRGLHETEIANGFANRFLFACAKRWQLLPDGGCPPDRELAPLVVRLREALRFASVQEELKRDEDARALWHHAYLNELSAARPGLLGAVTSRGEAQVVRLSVLYALLDLSQIVREPHLQAALALWRYCEASAERIFGDALGDPVADELLRALRAARERGGLTRTEISDLFKRNQPALRIEAALDSLAQLNLARKDHEPTGGRPGRPVERWVAT